MDGQSFRKSGFEQYIKWGPAVIRLNNWLLFLQPLLELNFQYPVTKLMIRVYDVKQKSLMTQQKVE